jgi:hypothetical protein
MSIENLFQQPRNVIYGNGMDSYGNLELGTVTATQIDIGSGTTPININGVPYGGGTTVIPQRIAYFTGTTSSTVDDSQITLDGTNNSLLFQQSGSVKCDNYFSSDGMINIGNPLVDTDIFMDASNSIVIGHEGGVVQIGEGVVTNYVRTSNVDRNGTPDPLNIGNTFASEVNLGRSGQNVNIASGATLMAQSIDFAGPIGLYPNSPFITFGGLGGDIMINGQLSFVASGPPSINYFSENKQFVVTGSGPFASQSIGTYSAQRLNTMVTFTIRWSVAPVAVIANSVLTLTPSLTADFLPMSIQSSSCSVQIAGANYSLGQVTVDTLGVITIVPSLAGTWTIGMMCSFGTICISYDISI